MRKNFRKLSLSVVVLLLLSIFMIACSSPDKTDEPNGDQTPPPAAAETKGEILLSTTTSTDDSGLLAAILPEFEKKTGYEVKVIAVGTGAALQMGRDGDADVLLVHAKASEEEFVSEGHGLERFDVMYNDFIIIGPEDDTLNLLKDAKADVVKGLSIIEEAQKTFISRGDDSGTHKKELGLWKEANKEPSGDWYVEAGQGMGSVIQMTNELQGYTLTDRATYLSMMDDLDLKVVLEGDTKLFNQYGVIAVNPDKSDKINHDGAEAFKDWILSKEAQDLIGEFGKEKFGQALFVPNAK